VLQDSEELHDLLHEMNELRDVLAERKVERLKWRLSERLGKLYELMGEPETARDLLAQAREELERLLESLPSGLGRHLRLRRDALLTETEPRTEAGEAARLRERVARLEALNRSLVGENRRLRAPAEALTSRVAVESNGVSSRAEDRLAAAGSSGLFYGLIGRSPPMLRLYDVLQKAAPADLPILIRGETGTGKDLVARAIHRMSPRRGGPFIAESLSAIPPGLLESEVFGHAAGAFSGALGEREGLLVAAHLGTLYLADIGEIPLEVQAKLVRALESAEVRPLGAQDVRRVDFRLVTSSQRDLHHAVADGAFREDLLFRIQGIEVVLPPLRERREDIPLLVEHFLGVEADRSHGKLKLEPDALKRLVEHDWPGNVRELENEIRRLAILGSGRIRAADLALAPRSSAGLELLRPGVVEKFSLPEAREALERVYFERALRASDGSLKDLASRMGVHKRTIAKIRKRLGLEDRRAEP
jgi:DNA-binding NtrC family response regulator